MLDANFFFGQFFWPPTINIKWLLPNHSVMMRPRTVNAAHDIVLINLFSINWNINIFTWCINTVTVWLLFNQYFSNNNSTFFSVKISIILKDYMFTEFRPWPNLESVWTCYHGYNSYWWLVKNMHGRALQYNLCIYVYIYTFILSSNIYQYKYSFASSVHK